MLASADFSTAGCDYKTLKQNKSLIGKVLGRRSTSISQARLDREFNTSGVSKESKTKNRRGSTDAADNASKLIQSLTFGTDEDAELNTSLQHESLPGTCKS